MLMLSSNHEDGKASIGFDINPYDMSVANPNINGNQHTIT